MGREENQVLGLAGVIQAAALIHTIATEDRSIPKFERALIHSIFATEPNSTADIYDGYDNIALGLYSLANGIAQLPPPVIKYTTQLLSLQKKCEGLEDFLQVVGRGISNTEERLQYYDLMHDNIIAGLSDLYQQTFSRMTPKVIIHGEAAILQQESRSNRIRALCFAAIRSATLWSQSNGKWWHLLFSKKRLAERATAIIRNESIPPL